MYKIQKLMSSIVGVPIFIIIFSIVISQGLWLHITKNHFTD